jgi:uncharacterized membrane protein YfcA
VINTLAGGGGLLVLPLLVFAGLPATVANGTYRLAVALQCATASLTFERRGVSGVAFARPLLLPTVVGALVGVGLAMVIDESAFRKVLAVALVVMLLPVLRPRSVAPPDGERPWWLAPAFFLVGIYGGFLQAGVGFVYLALLTGVLGLDLVRANAVKVFLVLVYTVLAVALFAWQGRFALVPAVAVAVGHAIGGWLGAHLAIRRGETLVRVVLVVAVLVSAAKLLGLLDPLLP